MLSARIGLCRLLKFLSCRLELGQDILANVCPSCWSGWTQESVNIINHTGLQPVDPADRQRLYLLLREHLKLPPEVS